MLKKIIATLCFLLGIISLYLHFTPGFHAPSYCLWIGIALIALSLLLFISVFRSTMRAWEQGEWLEAKGEIVDEFHESEGHRIILILSLHCKELGTFQTRDFCSDLDHDRLRKGNKVVALVQAHDPKIILSIHKLLT